jgi:Na+-transporting NADH:ubiquinone oxidoreductase subunit NqrB
MIHWLTLSLIVNIVVLIPVCNGLLTNAAWTQSAYGGATPARGILLAVYLAILVSSVVLLFVKDPRLTAVLLVVQIIYKLLTPFTTGNMQNPVVVSNLAIAAFHVFTLWLTFGSSRKG